MVSQTATAAVAIIRCLAPEENFLIIRRAAHPQDPWSGHFSFPGGRKEEQDRHLLDTCIRETAEEVGIQLTPESMQVKLPVTPAGRNAQNPIWVQPFIFFLREKPQTRINHKEVQSLCWINAKDFQDKNRHREVELQPDRVVNTFPLGDYYLWGFTYKLLQSIINK